MTAQLNALIIAAASIGFFHTILGPDHYLPFVMIGWARRWSTHKTILVTLTCGIGHIGSSILLGMIGVSLGLAVKKLELVESVRGDLAAWFLIAFGLVYLVWGLRRAYRNQPHVHGHAHTDEDAHTHPHTHQQEHVHVHYDEASSSMAPWALFVIFIFGPCEPLIPLLMYPAAKNSTMDLCIVTGVFGIVTIATMLGAVLLSIKGVKFIPLTQFQRFAHVIAGATICLCGLAIQFLGL